MSGNPYASPQAEQSPTTPKRDASSGDLRSAFKTTFFVHVIPFALTALMLDGGRMFQFCILAMIAFWVGTLFILARRRRSPTRFDLWFIRYGVIPLWLTAPWVAEAAYVLIGDRLF